MSRRNRRPARRPVRRAAEPAPEPVDPGFGPGAWVALGAALALSIALVYSPVSHHGFLELWDDPDYVTANAVVKEGLSGEGVVYAFTTFTMGNYHPLTWLSHMLDVSLFGLAPAGHHWSAVVLHILGSLALLAALFGLLVRNEPPGPRLSARTRSIACFVIVVFWALHPLRVESVAWIAERKDVLSGAFFFLALWLYARAVQAPDARRLRLFVLLHLAFAGSLLSKATAVTAPALFLVLDVWPLGRLSFAKAGDRGLVALLWPRIREKLGLASLSAIAAVLAILAQGEAQALSDLEAVGAATRITVAIAAAAQYLLQMVWPVDLAAFYPYPHIAFTPEQWMLRSAIAAAVVGGLAATAVALRRRAPWLACGLSFYVIALLPVSGLVRIGAQAWADRYTYLPSVGVLLAVVWSVGVWVEARGPETARMRTTAAGAVAFGVACAVAATAWAQVGVWRDAETLFTAANERVDRNYRAELHLGAVEAIRGHDDLALPHLLRAAEIAPKVPTVQMQLALLHLRQQRYAEAAPHLRAVAHQYPNNVPVQFGLALIAANEGDRVTARRHVERVLTLEPGEPAALELLRRLGPPPAQNE